MVPRSLMMFAAIAATALPTGASADPCEGALPSRAGTVFSGSARYVVDGDGLCLGASTDPRKWVEVRLADFDAPELYGPGGYAARGRLTKVVGNQLVTCQAVRGRSGRVIVHDRVISACWIGKRRLGDALRAAGGVEGGN